MKTHWISFEILDRILLDHDSFGTFEQVDEYLLDEYNLEALYVDDTKMELVWKNCGTDLDDYYQYGVHDDRLLTLFLLKYGI